MWLCLFHVSHMLPAQFFQISSCSVLSWDVLSMTPSRQLLSSTLDKFTMVSRHSSYRCVLLFSLKLRKTHSLVTGLCPETGHKCPCWLKAASFVSCCVLSQPQHPREDSPQEGFKWEESVNECWSSRKHGTHALTAPTSSHAGTGDIMTWRTPPV